jgi:predicted transposase YdaD
LVHQTIAGLGAALPIPEELTEMQTMMSRLPEIWKQQYLAEGEAKGEARGRAEGEAWGAIKGEAKALILLTEQRFGPLPQALRERVESADAVAVETWLGRVLAATSLETLFGTAN